jgi:hypothetical protein
MIDLRFDADASPSEAEDPLRVAAMPGADIVYVAFERPVTFSVGARQLLGEQGAGYPVPIAGLALMVLEGLRDLPAKRQLSVRVPGGGWLTFTMKDDSSVMIESSITRASAEVMFDHLKSTWIEFGGQVIDFLLDRFPDLRTRTPIQTLSGLVNDKTS